MAKKRRSSKRVYGEQGLYFLFHNFISLSFFFVFAWCFGLYSLQNDSLRQVFSLDFWGFLGVIFMMTVLFGLFARIFAYYIMKGVYDYINSKNEKYVRSLKTFGELNQGINALGLKWLFACLLTSLIFVFGIVALFQASMLGKITIWTFILAYAIIKITITLIVNFFVETKL